MQGVQVPSLVKGIRSHVPCIQKKQNVKQKPCCNKFNKDFKKWFISKRGGGADFHSSSFRSFVHIFGVEEACDYTKDLYQDIAVYSREETSQGPQLRKAKL